MFIFYNKTGIYTMVKVLNNVVFSIYTLYLMPREKGIVYNIMVSTLVPFKFHNIIIIFYFV